MRFEVTVLNNKIKLLFQLTENFLLNETIIISNRKVFDFEHKDSTNGKSIISYMINKAEKKAQAGKENINITDTD